MNTIDLKNSKNEVVDTFYFEQFKMNDQQQVVCMVGDFEKYGGISAILQDNSICTNKSIGKLSDQHFIFAQLIRCSLSIALWNFEKYPNPEIILQNKLS